MKRAIKSILRRIHVNIGRLYTQAPPLRRRIPNQVYQTWVSPVVPSLLALQIRRFRRLNPDFSFSFFDDLRMASYMDREWAGHPIQDIFHRVRLPAVRADIWRYCVLFREGGVYCDIKSALTAPLRDLVPADSSELLSFEENRWSDYLDVAQYTEPGLFLPEPPSSVRAQLEHPDHIICNWCVCFEKGSPILERLISLIVRHAPFFRGRAFDRPDRAGNHFTGPLALTQVVWQWIQETGRRPGQAGIDFAGKGAWRLSGMSYRKSPHHSTYRNTTILG